MNKVVILQSHFTFQVNFKGTRKQDIIEKTLNGYLIEVFKRIPNRILLLRDKLVKIVLVTFIQ